MKKLLSITAGLFAALTINAQCPQISCPSNITVNNDPGTCGAVVNYTTPVGTNPCGADSVVFTNCGATGRFGPTQGQVNTAYSGTNLDGKVTINTQGFQEWTVPLTGTYKIVAKGAQGGGSFPGFGASITGEVALTQGAVLKIVVGQEGHISSCEGGGGGGSFVSTLANVPLIVAGGGGASNINQVDEKHGRITTGGGITTTTAGGIYEGTPGINGNGSTVAYTYLTGAGGFNTNGTTNLNAGGQAFVNGAVGGAGSRFGGFGCGGSADLSGWCRMGGGGGYSGGASGLMSGSFSAGGGGSYNSGSNQTNLSGVNSGHGSVVISWTGGTAVTTQTSGLPDGGTFPVGVTTNWYKVEDGLGNKDSCSFTVTVVDNESPSISCPNDTTICWGIYNATIATSDNCPNETVAQIAGPTLGSSFDVGTYTLEFVVTDASGNKDTCNYNVTVEVCGGVNENNSKYGISVYPNPMKEYVIIENKNIEGSYTIEITNTLGAIVKTVTSNSKRLEIAKGEMSKGMYYYSIKQNNQTLSSGKLAVE
jgi:hypothetical protein